MYRKSLLSFLFLITLSFIGVSARAQPISGVVELEKSGARAPLAGAKVDLFREDVVGKGQSVTTGADGKFSFATVEAGFKYMLSISGPGAAPNYFAEISPGTQSYLAILIAGGGESLTEEQLKGGIAKLSAEERQKRIEDNKKAQQILSSNKKIEDSTRLNQVALKEGIPALQAKKYGEAIAMFDAAIDASPDYEGSAPVFLNAKAVALKGRARDGIVAAQKGDAAARTAAKEKAIPDYTLAIASFERGLEVIAKAPADSTAKVVMEESKQNLYFNYIQTLAEMYETYLPVPETVDASKVLAGFLTTEPDTKKQQSVLAGFGDKALRGGAIQASAMAFKKILETSPKDLDALSGASVSLGALAFSDGISPAEAKTSMQEAERFGKQYLDAAPKDHKNQAAVVNIMETIKAESSSKKN
jgi:hypothetical protein